MSDKRNSTIICHRCRWGAAPGKLTRCSCPDIGSDLRQLDTAGTIAVDGVSKSDTGVNPVAWALPSMAAATGNCAYFAPEEAEPKRAI